MAMVLVLFIISTRTALAGLMNGLPLCSWTSSVVLLEPIRLESTRERRASLQPGVLAAYELLVCTVLVSNIRKQYRRPDAGFVLTTAQSLARIDRLQPPVAGRPPRRFSPCTACKELAAIDYLNQRWRALFHAPCSTLAPATEPLFQSAWPRPVRLMQVGTHDTRQRRPGPT